MTDAGARGTPQTRGAAAVRGIAVMGIGAAVWCVTAAAGWLVHGYLDGQLETAPSYEAAEAARAAIRHASRLQGWAECAGLAAIAAGAWRSRRTPWTAALASALLAWWLLYWLRAPVWLSNDVEMWLFRGRLLAFAALWTALLLELARPAARRSRAAFALAGLGLGAALWRVGVNLLMSLGPVMPVVDYHPWIWRATSVAAALITGGAALLLALRARRGAALPVTARVPRLAEGGRALREAGRGLNYSLLALAVVTIGFPLPGALGAAVRAAALLVLLLAQLHALRGLSRASASTGAASGLRLAAAIACMLAAQAVTAQTASGIPSLELPRLDLALTVPWFAAEMLLFAHLIATGRRLGASELVGRARSSRARVATAVAIFSGLTWSIGPLDNLFFLFLTLGALAVGLQRVASTAHQVADEMQRQAGTDLARARTVERT